MRKWKIDRKWVWISEKWKIGKARVTLFVGDFHSQISFILILKFFCAKLKRNGSDMKSHESNFRPRADNRVVLVLNFVSVNRFKMNQRS